MNASGAFTPLCLGEMPHIIVLSDYLKSANYNSAFELNFFWILRVVQKPRNVAKNIFVTRFKNNKLNESIEELDLPDNREQNILKDELIKSTNKDEMKAGLEYTMYCKEVNPSNNALKVRNVFYK